jgi:hypothetical protein
VKANEIGKWKKADRSGLLAEGEREQRITHIDRQAKSVE